MEQTRSRRRDRHRRLWGHLKLGEPHLSFETTTSFQHTPHESITTFTCLALSEAHLLISDSHDTICSFGDTAVRRKVPSPTTLSRALNESRCRHGILGSHPSPLKRPTRSQIIVSRSRLRRLGCGKSKSIGNMVSKSASGRPFSHPSAHESDIRKGHIAPQAAAGDEQHRSSVCWDRSLSLLHPELGRREEGIEDREELCRCCREGCKR